MPSQAPASRATVVHSQPLLLAPISPPEPLFVSPEQPGFDLETGRILDPVAYALWQKAESQRCQVELEKQPIISVAEVFLEAQRALQEWVDTEANKPLVASGDMEAIRNDAAVQELLARYENYGPVMQEKLWKRLTFLVDNRKKFFKAFG
jgi:hypothetical protein